MGENQTHALLKNSLALLASLVGLFTCTYSAVTALIGSEPMCLSGGCTDWYQNGPLSKLIGVPIAVWGLAVWIGILTLRGRPPEKPIALLFALTCVVFQAVGYSVTHGLCTVCLVHTGAACLFAITRWRTESREFAPQWFIGAVLIGAGIAYALPTTQPPTRIEEALLKVPLADLEAASVTLDPGKRKETVVYAVVDLNCGHCALWLKKISSAGSLNYPCKVIWGSSVPLESLQQDENQVADRFAGNPRELRRYFSGVDPRQLKEQPQPDRKAAAEGLYARINLRSVPYFVVVGERKEVMRSTRAKALLLGH